MAAEVVWSAAALADLDRFAEFLRDEHPRMSREIAAAWKARARVLVDHPQIGRALSASPVYRRLFVRALHAIYALDYRFAGDRVVILRVTHGRERRS